MAVSAPCVNSVIPKINNIHEIINCTIICHDIGTIVTAKISTIHIIGRIDRLDSLNFFSKAFVNFAPPFFVLKRLNFAVLISKTTKNRWRVTRQRITLPQPVFFFILLYGHLILVSTKFNHIF